MKLALFAVLACAGIGNAGVVGDSVDLKFDFPTVGAVFADGGTKTIDGTVEYPAGSFAAYNADISVQITNTQLTLAGAVGIFDTGTFNGIDLTFLTGTITGAAADGSSNYNPVISIVGNELFLNYQGLDPSAGQRSIVDLTGTGSSVPEPTTAGFLGSGFAGLVLIGWRRSRRISSPR